ncbi:alpha/beta fold hydrolase [Spirilliplanes yamanashiensis]|uniref:Hydrolase n=1 Tax=Spirilliplanes yamanashiensis TaxID=42233 RepID=A0A8J3Y5B0_9ACTN|nr:alpha/beta hydrolase [Spirilliplanes yamanashiensis]MDP9814439.1 pimeloyl-ACP methyl ester carboxylesterase [Spirilliplanes yamanashiensis]GIJ02091.1 hydrolase [Spirilliplanes yamanashiensis]
MLLAADDVGSGPAVVLLHAGIADRRMWRAQVPALAAAGHRVIALDLPGCGDTPAPGHGYVRHDPVADALAARDIGAATLVGCSFGGLVAVDLALAHPHLVRSLILFGPAIGGAPADVPDAGAGLPEDDLEALAAAEAEMWLVGEGRPVSAVDPELLRLVTEMNLRDLRGEAELDKLDITALDPPAATRLADLTAPVTVTTGAHDWPAFRHNCDLIAAAAPAATRLPDIPGTAHLPPLEVPAAATEIILAALAR